MVGLGVGRVVGPAVGRVVGLGVDRVVGPAVGRVVGLVTGLSVMIQMV